MAQIAGKNCPPSFLLARESRDFKAFCAFVWTGHPTTAALHQLAESDRVALVIILY
jgi:hypothetical protein